MKIPLKIVALIGLLFWTGVVCSQSNRLSQKVSFELEDVSIKAALKKIEKQAEVNFAFGNLTQLDKKINGSYSNKTVQHILEDLLHPNGLDFKVVGNNVTIFVSKKKLKKIGKIIEPNPNYSVSGYIYDASTGEALIGATVHEPISYTGTTTNQFGFFSLQLPHGKNELVVSYIGFEEQKIIVEKAEQLKISLSVSGATLQEVIVTVNKNEEVVESATLGKMELKVAEINAIPAAVGEVDVLKAITFLPGIKQGVDAASGFYVRGGSSDQNLILLDGVPLYNPYHLWGFLSTFNADAINNIELTKGSFPAKYGGRLSSVLDITMKDGNNQKWDKELSVGLLSAKAKISGPVVKDKSSIMVTARRTYADLLVAPIRNARNKTATDALKENYSFTDINLKYNYKFSENDRLYVSGFYSRDKYRLGNTSKSTIDGNSFESKTERNQGWGNAIASMRWNHLFSQEMFVNTTAYFSNYNYFTQEKFENNNPDFTQNNNIEYSSKINDFGFKQDYEFFPNNKNKIRFGAGVIQHFFEPGVNFRRIQTGQNDIERKIGNKEINASEIAVYAEDEIDVLPWLKLNVGLHGSAFFVKDKSYTSLQPRLGSRFSINKNLSLKLGFSTMTQYLHLLTNSGIAQSSDLWVPSTKNVKPQNSAQYAAGIALNMNNGWLLEVDGYYKQMNNLIEYQDGANFTDSDQSWEEQIESGKGNSYGGELFLKKSKGKWTGWFGYTLSWANRKFDNINFGKEFPYKYDRRHDVSLVAKYQASKKWSFGGSWVFYTGNAVTLPQTAFVAPEFSGEVEVSSSVVPPGGAVAGNVLTSSGIIEGTTARNNFRLPAYHKLDISATRKWVKTKATHELTFGFTNLYNRKNPSFYFVETDIFGQTKYRTRSMFPLLPTLTYKIAF